MAASVCHLAVCGLALCIAASVAGAQPAEETRALAQEAKELGRKIDDNKDPVALRYIKEVAPPTVAVLIAIGGWVMAMHQLRRNEKRDAEKRAEDRDLAERRFREESDRADQRLWAEKQEADRLRRDQQAAADRARIESFLVDSLKYLSHGSRNRGIGIALIEAYWAHFPRLRPVWTPILVSQVLYLLAGPEAESATDPHDVVSLRRMVKLLRDADLSGGDRLALTGFLDDPAQHIPKVLETVARDIRALADRPPAAVGMPASPSGDVAPAARDATDRLMTPGLAPQAPLSRSRPMQDLFARLIAALGRGPDDPEVGPLLARIEAEAGPQAAADARALRDGWLRSQGRGAAPAPAAEDEVMARMAGRPNFDKELAALTAYTEGKMKRYSLLFAVNGGAFAIAKLLTGRPPADSPEPAVLGGLQFWQLAAGAAAFTLLMCFDIWTYGEMMRRHYFARAFGLPGRAVLAAMGGVLIAGWTVAAVVR